MDVMPEIFQLATTAAEQIDAMSFLPTLMLLDHFVVWELEDFARDMEYFS